MIAATAKFATHLAGSHHAVGRLGVWLPDDDGIYQHTGYLGIKSGTLTVDGRANIRRQGTFTVAPLTSLLDAAYVTDFDSRDYLEALTSQSAEITVEWGLVYPDLTQEWVTLARLRVEEPTRSERSGALEITGLDAAARVEDYPLITPYAPYDIGGTKLTVVEAIQDLVNAVYPTATPPTWVIAAGVDEVTVPPDNTVFTGSRWEAVNSLAKAIAAGVSANPDGEWVIAGTDPDRDPVWTVRPGAGGVLVDARTIFTRREGYNAVPVRWEDPNGGGGLAFVVDSDPASPTYWDGPYGRKPRPEEVLDTVTDSGQAIAAATAILQRVKGVSRSIDVTAVHNPLLEPNDVIAVFLTDGTAERHVVDGYELVFGAGSMRLSTRILRGGITYDEAGVLYDDPAYTYAGIGV